MLTLTAKRRRQYLLYRNIVMTTAIGGVVPVAISFLATSQSTADQQDYTFSSQSFGAAAADRRIVVAVLGRATGTTFDLSSVTIGGVSASEVVKRRNTTGGNTTVCALYIAEVPTGASGDVVVGFNESALRCLVANYRMVGALGTTATDTDGSTATAAATLTVPANGGAIGFAATTASTTSTASGLSEDFDTTLESVVTATSGHLNSSAGGNIAMSFTFASGGAGDLGVFAAWR